MMLPQSGDSEPSDIAGMGPCLQFCLRLKGKNGGLKMFPPVRSELSGDIYQIKC